MVILILPILSSLICGLFGRKIGYHGVKYFSCLLIIFGFIISVINLILIIKNNSIILVNLFTWFNIGLLNSSIILRLDLMVSGMLILVFIVSSSVHLYSVSYMSGDPHLPRFLSYLSLFTFFMIILITSSNLIQLFIGWEGVGLCSYLLINFWFSRIQANKSAIKAMVINKIGDMGLLLGIIILWFISGSFEFSELFLFFSNSNSQSNLFILSLLLIIIGIVGKSAQIGLHMWLPDAMEGPTPVSALIHAATMVTAGVFLIIRISPLFELSSTILLLIVLLGSFTSFFSAVIGLSQNDLKKVIAYSTCSQLGYMVTICGFSYYSMGLFHLINHGFFKALLFLSAGSIIHAFYDEQDFRKMGGVKKFLPLSYILIFIGSISLMGLPFLTGFYSKDLIIELINDSNYLIFALILSLIAASLTAFYSFRLIFYTFFSPPKINMVIFKKIHEGDLLLIFPLIILSIFSIIFGYFSQFIFFKDNFPLIVDNLNKFYPLILSLIGGLLSILLGLNLKKFWNLKSNIFINNIYNLSVYTWFFDSIINKFIIFPFLNTGYKINYKFIDNQILEVLGPNFFYKQLYILSNLISKIYSGKMSSYIFLLCLFILILININ